MATSSVSVAPSAVSAARSPASGGGASRYGLTARPDVSPEVVMGFAHHVRWKEAHGAVAVSVAPSAASAARSPASDGVASRYGRSARPAVSY